MPIVRSGNEPDAEFAQLEAVIDAAEAEAEAAIEEEQAGSESEQPEVAPPVKFKAAKDA